MITIRLAQKDPDAICKPDGLIQSFVHDMIAKNDANENVDITIGNENILTFFCVAVKEKRVSHHDLTVVCGKESIRVDSDGNMGTVAKEQGNYIGEALLKLF